MKHVSFVFNTIGIWTMGYFVFDYFGFKVMDYPYMDIVLIVLWTILSVILAILFQTALHIDKLKIEYKLQNELNIALEKQSKLGNDLENSLKKSIKLNEQIIGYIDFLLYLYKKYPNLLNPEVTEVFLKLIK